MAAVAKKRAGKHGGQRSGAGRKKGVRNKKTKKILELVEASGKTPLDVMLEVMRHAFTRFDHETALEAARSAAPYVHPKLASIEHTGANGSQLMPKEFRIKFISAVAPGLNPDGSDPA